MKVDRDMACAWICFPSLAKTSKVAMSYFNKSYVSTAIPVKENPLTLSKVVEKEGGSILSCLEKGFRDLEVFKCHGGEIMKDPSSPPALSSLDRRSAKGIVRSDSMRSGVRDILSNIHEVPAKESIRQKMLSKMVIAVTVGDYSALRDLNVGLTNVLQFVRGSMNWKRSWGGVKRDFYIPTKAGKDMFIPFFEGSSFVPGDHANSRKKMFSSTSFEVVQNTLGAGNIMPNLLDPYISSK